MTEIDLDDQTAEKLKRTAAVRGIGVAELLDEVIAHYLADQAEATRAPIDREQQAYEAQHAQLLADYVGQYIALRQGQVVDQDPDRSALGRRVRARYADEPVLITRVGAEPRQTIVVRGPRLAGDRE